VSNLQLTVPVPGGNVSTGYHTYGVDWEADTTTFYLDGKVTGSFATPAGLHKPMYMILPRLCPYHGIERLGPDPEGWF